MSTPLVESIMTTTPSADLLRSVAARMRELAEAATTGAWSHHCMGSEGCQVLNDGSLREHKSVAFFGRKDWQADHADAEYVAVMQPAVTLATARLLDELAEHAGHGSQAALVADGLDICRAFLDGSGWKALREMTEASTR